MWETAFVAGHDCYTLVLIVAVIIGSRSVQPWASQHFTQGWGWEFQEDPLLPEDLYVINGFWVGVGVISFLQWYSPHSYKQL